MQLLNIKSLLKNASFVKKREGVSPYLVVLHFVYMLVMNKKISTFMNQSNDSLKKTLTIDSCKIVATTGGNYSHSQT